MKLEMCVGSLEGARLANKYAVNRIETCIALEQGGLTPTISMVNWIHNTFQLEQHVLIRQRAGGFCYDYDELLIMRDQINAMREIGVAGVVIGALTPTYELDVDTLETWKSKSGNMDLTFNRAFDDVKVWKKGIDQLVKMGFKRILSSGQQPTVSSGLERLTEMVGYAAGRIEIMAGGGISDALVAPIIKTGVDAIHFSGTSATIIDETSLFSTTLLLPNEEKTRALVHAFQQINLD
jgi:copper homeostasis protein